jgi:hypothetical protein
MSVLAQLVQNFRRFSSRHSFLAVHDNDLGALLSQLGVLDDIENGTAVCALCGSQVSLDNLGGWTKLGSQIALFCEASDCLDAILDTPLRSHREHRENE